MKPKCVEAVQKAAADLGHDRPLTAAQIDAIDNNLRRAGRRLAGTDPEWSSKSTDERMMAAAEAAVQDAQREAALKVRRAQLQAIKTAATEQRIKDAHGENQNNRLVHDIDQTGDYVQGIKQEALGNLMALIDAVKSRTGTAMGRRVAMFLFDVQNPAMTRDLAAEIWANADGHTGNKLALEGAKAWQKVIDDQRQRFNAGGGDVGKLEYGFLPQPHDSARVRAAGREKWVNELLPKLNRERMIDENGAQLSEADARSMLHDVWETISTEGLNKQTPGAFKGSGARANAGSDARELHFKDADSYLEYLNNYGRGSMYDAMVSHVGRLSRDIGLVERYGPNPNATMKLQMDLAEHADGGVKRTFGIKPQSYWDVVNGTTSAPDSARIAQVGTDVRNVMTAGKLAGAVLASVTDVPSYFVTSGFNKLPYWDAFRNIGKLAASSETRRFLTSHGIIAETMIGDLNRWTNDNIKATWSGRMANSVLRLSLMSAWTDTLRRAFSLTMMQGMARMAGKDWEALSQWDRGRMERKGLTADDWGVIRQAELTKFRGVDHLTPESIMASGHERSSEIVAKVLGLIQDESEFAVLNPDLATKVIASGGTQRGTPLGELVRSAMQFKSFPIAMVSRHWRRVLDTPKVSDGSAPFLANRAVYAGAMLVSTTALGALAVQLKQLVSGKDPIDMRPNGPHPVKFWLKAAAQGGGMSIAGDMLLNDPGNTPADWIRSTSGTLMGPAVSTAAQALAIPISNVWEHAKGKPTHTAAETMQLMRSNSPWLNLWYAKAAIDHAGMNALQENMSPGYLARTRQRAQQDFGQQFWWAPGTGLPQRAPDIGKAFGQ